MANAHLSVNPDFVVGDVNPRIFGSFVEHLGRCVYGGIYEPGTPWSDEQGFRTDVAELTTELGVTCVRYPGGNFVSGYRWEDGIGPDRPARLDLAWKSLEPNTFGLDEFITWCRTVGVEPMLAVNLGTRGVAEALDLLEYCNVAGGTYWSDRRIANGFPEPHNVRIWCLGNEMDGPWQIGHKTAEEYGRLAAETARAMKMIDPTLELVACGSSSRSMPTFGTWEATVLAECWDVVDDISLHVYYEDHGDEQHFLTSAADMDAFISSVVATADHVAGVKKSNKRINLSFDEWNVWYMSHQDKVEREDWGFAPRLIEDTYTASDAVVVGDMLVTLLRHADRMGAACLAQLVNVIAPMKCEPDKQAWRQTSFHPFALTSAYGRGRVLRTDPVGPTIEREGLGQVGVLSAVATQDDAGVTLFAVNRSLSEDLELIVRIALDDMSVSKAVTLGHGQQTDAEPTELSGVILDPGTLSVTLPAGSWNMIRLE